MNKQAPSLARILVMVGFALSCFGLLLFLWLAFGGSIPLAPRGWRFEAQFNEATQLAKQADVRISGVTVGKVQKKALNKGADATNVTMQIDPKYAPIAKDTRAILRQKTLLGETYVELTPGSPRSPKLKEGGMLPVAARHGPPRAVRVPDQLAQLALPLRERGEHLAGVADERPGRRALRPQHA